MEPTLSSGAHDRNAQVPAQRLPGWGSRGWGSPGRGSLGWAVVYTGARPTVRVVGHLDRATISQVKGAIRGFRAIGIRHLVIDLSTAVDCDGRLLTVLASAHAQLADDAGALTITGVRLPEFLIALPAATLEEVFVLYQVLRRAPVPSHPIRSRAPALAHQLGPASGCGSFRRPTLIRAPTPKGRVMWHAGCRRPIQTLSRSVPGQARDRTGYGGGGAWVAAGCVAVQGRWLSVARSPSRCWRSPATSLMTARWPG